MLWKWLEREEGVERGEDALTLCKWSEKREDALVLCKWLEKEEQLEKEKTTALT